MSSFLPFCLSVEYSYFADPRLKALSETKYKEFRNWFDQRLDDAIAAAEAQENGNPNQLAIEGKVISNEFLSEYTLFNRICQVVQFRTNVTLLFLIFFFLSRCFFIFFGPYRKTVLRYAFVL